MVKNASSHKKDRLYRSIGFKVMGRDLDPDKVTEKLEIEPDVCSKRGLPIPYSSEKSKQGHWSIYLDRRDATLETRLRNLATFLGPKSKQLREIFKWKEVERKELEIIVYQYADEPVSSYEFDGELLKTFTALGVNIIFTAGLPIINETKPDKKRKLYEGVGFSMTGKGLNPEKVSEKIGIEPDICSMRGRPIPYINQKARQGQWIIHRDRRNITLETRLINLAKQIKLKHKQLKQILKWKDVEKAALEIVIEPSAFYPFCGHEFDGESLNTFTALGVNLVVTVWIPIFNED